MNQHTEPSPLLAVAAVGAYAVAIVAANAAISLVGPVPVGFGLVAPAGVYFAGLSFTLRDVVQERLGRRWVFVAVALGALLSALLSGPLALASGAAFLASELADFAVYTPLRRRSWLGAVLASNTVGAVLDSALFLWLAFGSLQFMWGQVLGKTWATLAVVAAVWWWRAWSAHRARGVAAAALLRGR